jgi:hypothetical protein
MPFQNNVLAGASAQGGYQIANSLRFRASNSAYLSRSFGSPTSNIKWTWSGWIKRGTLGSQQIFCAGDGSSNNFFAVAYTASDTIQISQIASGAYNVQMATTAVFRDPSAWYHLVVIYDSANATSTDRIQIYVNNSRQTVSYSTGPFGASTACQWNVSGRTHYLRRLDYVALYGDMYAANETFIDGQALTPSSFGQTDATTGVWVPKSYSGTFGANGFFLQFKDAASTTTIGYDTSGNSNNFTTSGISVTSGVTFDQSLDTPTTNFSTMNPIASHTSVGTFAAANMQWSYGGASYYAIVVGSAAINFKAYWEVTVTSVGGAAYIGIILASQQIKGTEGTNNTLTSAGCWSYDNTGKKNNNNAPGSGTAYGSTYTTGDVIGVTYDPSTTTLTFYKNNVSQGSAYTNVTSGDVYAFVSGISGADFAVNFGQRPFAYTPPTGFKALNTANLSVPVIKKPSTLMDIASYTGNGSTQSISSLTFQPDLVWIKSRSAATTTNIFDSQRGVQKGIQSTGPNAEYTDANTLTAFNSTGFSLGSDASSRGVNINTNTYAAWNWKESNSAGLDIVLYTGNGGGARNIAHGLGVAPKWMFVRGRDARVWAGWHTNLTSAAYYMDLGTAAAEAVDTTMFDSTAPDASNFRVGSYNNVNAVNYVTYLWSEVSGFSRFGSYVGNASTDGPFVWCGFSPKWIVIKARSIATSWMIFNPTGTSPNEAILRVLTDTAGAETSNTYGIDYLSNGFKVRAPSGYSINNSGETYTFAAFAEAPFKYARAR